MKTNLLSFSISLLLCSTVFAQSYTEGTDLPGTGTGPAFTISGTTTIAGGLNTPGDGQDRFQITVPMGCQITSVTYSLTDNANIGVNGFVQFGPANQQNIPPLSGSFANGPTGAFPVGQGTYDCMMVANIAANDSWSIVFNALCLNGVAEYSSTNPISVYPNPAAETIFFEVNSVNQTSEIIISDALGRKNSSESFNGNNKLEFSVGDLVEGIYFYQLLENGEIVTTGKFAVQQ